MTKVRFLTIAVIGLVVLNAALIVGMVLSRPPAHPPHPKDVHKGPMKDRPKKIIVDRLEFDEGQVKQFEVFIDKHSGVVKTQDKGIQSSKRELYALLNTDDFSARDSLVGQLIEHLRVIETAHFDHFADIKSICREDQMEAYEELTHEIQEIFRPKGPPRK